MTHPEPTPEYSMGRAILTAAQDHIVQTIVRWMLNQLAHPKRPERTPRKIKKAAKKALARLNPAP